MLFIMRNILPGGSYPGTIRADLYGHPGTNLYPGKRILSLYGHPGTNLYPGQSVSLRCAACASKVLQPVPGARTRSFSRAPSQGLYGHPGNNEYPGKPHHSFEDGCTKLQQPILSWDKLLSGWPGNKLYTGIRAQACSRAPGQNRLYG